MTDVYYGYLQWGATAKVKAIVEAHPALLLQTALLRPAPVEMRAIPLRTSSLSSRRSSTSKLDALDLEAVMKAAHAMASELVLDKVLDRRMRIIAESAGVQRGVLLLDRDGELVVDASIAFDPVKVEIGPSVELVVFAGSMVGEVARIGKTLVLEDARTDARFAADPYEMTLWGAATAQAKMVIIDITGIKAMGAAVANTLVQTTTALRLLGTQAAVTSIRPDVAQTLVALGVNLGATLTFGTLRNGITYVFARSPGARVASRGGDAGALLPRTWSTSR